MRHRSVDRSTGCVKTCVMFAVSGDAAVIYEDRAVVAAYLERIVALPEFSDERASLLRLLTEEPALRALVLRSTEQASARQYCRRQP